MLNSKYTYQNKREEKNFLVNIIRAILSIIPVVVVIVMLFITAVLLGWLCITLKRTKSSKNWETVEGIVVESRIVSNQNCNGLPGYHYKIIYQYKIGEEIYSSSKVRFGNFRYYYFSSTQKIVNLFPIGSKVTVYYDSTDLKQDIEPTSVLLPGFNIEIFYPISLFFIFLFVELFFVGFLGQFLFF